VQEVRDIGAGEHGAQLESEAVRFDRVLELAGLDGAAHVVGEQPDPLTLAVGDTVADRTVGGRDLDCHRGEEAALGPVATGDRIEETVAQHTQSGFLARQHDLRQSYARSPEAAITEKRVRTVQTPATDAIHGAVEPDGFDTGRWDYGIDAKIGGLDDRPNPGHVLCAALAGCMDSTIRMLAEHLRVEIDRLEVEVVGDVDLRGCLDMSASVRPGFRRISCRIDLRPADGTDPRLSRMLLEHAERLCVTLDTLRNGVPVHVSAVPES